MKRNHVILAALLASFSFLAAPSASALPQSQVAAIKKAVAVVPAAEIAAKATELILQANKVDRQEVAIATVREIVSKRPAAAVAVVGAIAKAAPELSAIVAAEATKLASDQAAEIAKAAAASAPDQAERIATAVAKVAPNASPNIARAVVTVAPQSTSKVVESMVASVPAAKNVADDPVVKRMSQRAASGAVPQGEIFTRAGTISGRLPPSEPPITVGEPTIGAAYGRP